MKKQQLFASLALAITLCMLAVAVASPVLFDQQEEQPVQDEIVLAGWTDNLFNKWKDDNGNIRWGFFAVDMTAHVIPLTALGWELHRYYYGDGQVAPPNTSAGDEGELAKQMRIHEAEIVFTVLNSNKELLANSISGYADIWKFSNSYWMRQAEIAATEYWALDEEYNSAHIFERSGLAENLAKLYANMEEGTDTTFAFLNDRLTTWSQESGYGNMSIVISYGNQTLSGSAMDIKIRNGISVTSSSANKAYLDGRELWVTGGTASIYAENGTKYDLSSGYNDLAALGVQAGTYVFQSDRQYAGSIIPTMTNNAVRVYPSAVLISDSDCKIAFYSNNSVIVDSKSYDTLGIKVSTGDNSESNTVDLLPILKEQGTILTATEQTLSKAHASAQAIWHVFNATKEANILLSPSALVPDNSVEVSADELYLLTIAYLQQIYDFYERTNGNIKETGFNISADSLDLLVRGDIYDANGNKIYESVVFTPYVWLDDLTLRAGTVNVTQAGTVAIWGEEQDLANYTKSDELPQLVSIAPNYSFDVKQIKHSDEFVDSYTVTIKEVQKWHEITVAPTPTPVPVPHLIDAVPLVAVILGLIALCFLELWIITECEFWWLWIIIAIFAILALFGAEWITGML